jgi:thioredoxin reductase
MELRVAVIGAGPAGLVAAKHFKDCPDVREVKVFECRDEVGGQWHYSALTDCETPAEDLHKQVYSTAQCSMYDDLYVNLPSHLMTFKDFPRTFSRPYCHRSEILTYMQEYARQFALYPLIHFNTVVTLVNPVSQEEIEVTTRDTQGRQQTEVFNRVAVCKGTFSVPYIPEVQGMSSFPGRINHFKKFKELRPSEFEGKTVVVVGGSYSSIDAIRVLLVSCHNTTVVLSDSERALMAHLLKSRELAPYAEQQRIFRRPYIKTIRGPEVEFEDGSCHRVDEIMLCTGYQRTVPFIPHQVVSEQGRYLHDLYKGIIDINHPRIAHVGLYIGVTTVHLELSVMFVLQEWLKTPDVAAMRQELRQDEQGLLDKHLPLRSVYRDLLVAPRRCFAFFSKFGVGLAQTAVEEISAAFSQHWKLLNSNCLTYKHISWEKL